MIIQQRFLHNDSTVNTYVRRYTQTHKVSHWALYGMLVVLTED